MIETIEQARTFLKKNYPQHCEDTEFLPYSEKKAFNPICLKFNGETQVIGTPLSPESLDFILLVTWGE